MIDGPAQVEAAQVRIQKWVRRTPLVEIDLPDGTTVDLKLELLQHTGSFKPRGAFNKALTASVSDAGLIAASGGNHGLAVAHVAERLGYEAQIVVPEVIGPAKLKRLRATSAKITIAGAVYADALAASHEMATSTGAVMVHAYDDSGVISGQGTTFMELQEQAPDVDGVVVAVGGGGLCSGAAAWFGTDVAIHGVETTGTPTLHSALAAGRPVEVGVSGIAADSLGASKLGGECYQLLAKRVSSVLVGDVDVAQAQRFLWEKCRVVAEPGGATALAGVLSGVVDLTPYRRPVVLVCGANTDPSSVAESRS